MLITLHPPDEAEACAALRRFLRRILGRALAFFKKRERAAAWSADDWRQIENELVFRDGRWRYESR
jgi:hypothetical protein